MNPRALALDGGFHRANRISIASVFLVGGKML
jgi:hypothetical protein